IAMVALYRPGPMELIPDYIARKHGKKEIVYLHPKLEPILRNTQGICIYQEQLMQIARDLAGFSMGEADVLRKAVGKKIESLLMEQQEKIVSGMAKNGIPKNVANQLWNWVLPFAHYGFNRSHSACYATVAYQTGWLKANYPLEFMSALLTSERNDVERIAFLIEETRKMGIEVLPPEVNESFAFFSAVPAKNQIRFGLLAIKNVGEGIVASIISERKAAGSYTSIQDFVSRVATKDLNKKSMESLIKAGVFDQFGERNQLLKNMERLLSIARENQRVKATGQKGLFEALPQDSPTALILESSDPAKESELLTWEKELLGLYVTSHPLKGLKHILENRALAIRSLEEAMQEIQNTRFKFQFSRQKERLCIGGIISSVKKIITKAGKPMLFMSLEDLTDKIEVVVFPSVIEKYPVALQVNKIVFITGRLDSRDGEKKFLAEEVEEIIAS
ncbi:MAG TPA: DNA polymerase III subunit alpha, partial [Candidatus Paceibacterota bacterium]